MINDFFKGWRKWAIVTTCALGLFAAFNWQAIALGIAASRSERAPEILRDFSWPNQAYSQGFATEFSKGTSERMLLEWLESEEFEINLAQSRATRIYAGIPCRVGFQVDWESEEGVLSQNASAKLIDYACL